VLGRDFREASDFVKVSVTRAARARVLSSDVGAARIALGSRKSHLTPGGSVFLTLSDVHA